MDSRIWYILWLTCLVLSLEQSSLHAAHIHKCDDLISSVFLRVWRLIVSVNSWLWMRLAAPRRSHLLPSPRSHPFSITTSRVWEGAVTLLVLNHSVRVAKTVGGSRVTVSPTTATPASSSALSLLSTPACPGQKIQTTLTRLLLRIASFHSACSPHDRFAVVW